MICLIDRSIIENASGRSKSVLESVKNSLKTIMTKPQMFFFSKPFALIYVSPTRWREGGAPIVQEIVGRRLTVEVLGVR